MELTLKAFEKLSFAGCANNSVVANVNNAVRKNVAVFIMVVLVCNILLNDYNIDDNHSIPNVQTNKTDII